jgi:oligopeptide/dipeptide ABC transporter ATP-binding protein
MTETLKEDPDVEAESDEPDTIEVAMPHGCRFHPRCVHAFTPCTTTDPSPLPVTEAHSAACHLLAVPSTRS